MFALGFGLGAAAMFGVLLLIIHGSSPDTSSSSQAAALPTSTDLLTEGPEYQARLDAYLAALAREDILDPDYGLTEDTDEH